MYEMRHGDALEQLTAMPANSVHCVVTSPPYWGLRDYGIDGQVGLEPTPGEYIEKLVGVFAQVRRVLRDDGTLWLNMGDCYAGSAMSGGTNFKQPPAPIFKKPVTVPPSLKAKDLLMMPAHVALALQANGWWIRSDIIWSKPNPMPEPVTDRPTKAHEYLFLLTKSPSYYYDQLAIRETGSHVSGGACFGKQSHDDPMAQSRRYDRPVYTTRNARSLWTIPTQAYPGAHFATFPEQLVRRCLAAGVSDKGCCAACGAPWERVVDRKGGPPPGDHRLREALKDCKSAHESGTVAGSALSEIYRKYGYATFFTTGWRPGCKCPGRDGDHPGSEVADPDNWARVPCTVLDPFAGSGTVGAVGCAMGHRFIGIDLSERYCQMARSRIERALKPHTHHSDHVAAEPGLWTTDCGR